MHFKKVINDPCVQVGILLGLFIVVDKLFLESRHSTRLAGRLINSIFRVVENEEETIN